MSLKTHIGTFGKKRLVIIRMPRENKRKGSFIKLLVRMIVNVSNVKAWEEEIAQLGPMQSSLLSARVFIFDYGHSNTFWRKACKHNCQN